MIYYIFLVVFFIDAGVNIIAVAKENKKLEHISKPLLMPLLTLYFIFAILTIDFYWLIIIALLCGCAGDIFLMLENEEKWFIFGMIAFFFNQIFYIIAFLYSIGNFLTFPLWGFFLITPAIITVLVTYPKFKDHMGDLKIPVHVYLAIILLMYISAILRLARYDFFCPCFLLVWLGSFMYIFSDSLVAIDTFNKEIQLPRPLIISTYIIAQFLITQGIILSVLL